jgi:hypothetical protein
LSALNIALNGSKLVWEVVRCDFFEAVLSEVVVLGAMWLDISLVQTRGPGQSFLLACPLDFSPHNFNSCQEPQQSFLDTDMKDS